MKNKEKVLGEALLLHFLLSLTAGLLSGVTGDGAVGNALTVVFTPIRYALPILYYRNKTGYTPFFSPIDGEGGIKKERTRAFSVTVFVFAISVTVITLNTVGALTDLLSSALGNGANAPSSGIKNGAVYTFVKSVLLASFFEEMLFRGAVLHALSERKATVRIFACATFFALMHCNAEQFFYAFTAGALIAFFTVTTGSLILSVAVHFGANLTSFLFSLFKSSLSASIYNTVATVTFVSLMLVSLFSGALYFLKYREKLKDSDVSRTESIPREIWIYLLVTAVFTAIGSLLA